MSDWERKSIDAGHRVGRIGRKLEAIDKTKRGDVWKRRQSAPLMAAVRELLFREQRASSLHERHERHRRAREAAAERRDRWRSAA